MSVQDAVTEAVEVQPQLHDELADAIADDDDFGAELSDDELGELVVREITIDGMCGVY